MRKALDVQVIRTQNQAESKVLVACNLNDMLATDYLGLNSRSKTTRNV